MSTRAITPEHPKVAAEDVPALESGDHLTRDEFERRYAAMPENVRAQLIEGVVYMAPPALRWDYHGTPHANLMYWMVHYRATTPGVIVGDNSSVRLDMDNEPQPDAAMIIDPAHGGQAKFSSDGLLEGAPELVGEVSGTTASIDMNAKLRAYRRNGVCEYLVWRVREKAIDWFVLRNGRFEPLPRDDGVIRSETFPGLWLDPASLIDDDPTAALRVLDQGLKSPEHAAFVETLKSRAGGP
jgi:Uma2 family endonuclease